MSNKNLLLFLGCEILRLTMFKISDFNEKTQAAIRAQLHPRVRPVPPAVPQPLRRQVAPDHARQGRSPRRLVVSLIGLRRRTLDDDNFNGACKHLRDAIAASLHMDDGDKALRWQYQQLHTTGREGVIVQIELI